MTNKEKLKFLMSACDIFDEITPNELRVLVCLRQNELPSHIGKMDVKISEGKLKSLVSDMKKRGIIMQPAIMGAISLTPKGNTLLDNLLIRIDAK